MGVDNQLYDIEAVVSFTAEDMEEAEQMLDKFMDIAEENDYSVQQATLAEAALED